MASLPARSGLRHSSVLRPRWSSSAPVTIATARQHACGEGAQSLGGGARGSGCWQGGGARRRELEGAGGSTHQRGCREDPSQQLEAL